MKFYSILLSLCIAVVFALIGCKGKQSEIQRTDSKPDSTVTIIDKIKPDTLQMPSVKNSVKLVVKNKTGKSLWLTNAAGTFNKKIMKLGDEDSVYSPVHSPNGKYLAFVVYNSAGHSPLTTSHVWIAGTDGESLSEVVLPSPGERFSTYNPKWKNDDLLIVTGVTLTRMEGQKYLFNINSKKIEVLGSK